MERLSLSDNLQSLSPEQKLKLYHDGFVVIPNVVPQDMIKVALRAINQEIGKGLLCHLCNCFGVI
jgi:hypothetical protein